LSHAIKTTATAILNIIFFIFIFLRLVSVLTKLDKNKPNF
jgi:uncharacterized membrane protein YtjA (UPF0391 family)